MKTSPAPVRFNQPCGVFFCPVGDFCPRWGLFGGFFRGIFEKIPHKKVSVFKAFGDFWGNGELFFKYIRMYNNIKIYIGLRKNAPQSPILPPLDLFEVSLLTNCCQN